MKILELPIKFIIPSEENEVYQEMGIKVDAPIEDGTLKIKAKFIYAWARSDENSTSIYIKNGDSWKVYLSIEEFEKLLND